MNHKTKSRLLLFFLCSIVVTGCNIAEQTTIATSETGIERTQEEQKEASVKKEETKKKEEMTQEEASEESIEEIQRRMREKSGVADVPLVRPDVFPKVRVSFAGYEHDAKKAAYFEGENLSETFSVINADTKEVVFEGRMETYLYDKESDTQVSKGDFTAVRETGTYYIETDRIGQSYYFEIYDCDTQIHANSSKTIYKSVYQELLTEIETWDWQSEQIDVKNAAKSLSELLLCYEMYGKDEKLLELSAIKIGKLFIAQTEDGSVYARLNDDRAEISYEAGNYFAAVMAQCSMVYKEQDAQLSSQCLKAAKQAYEYNKLQQSEMTKAQNKTLDHGEVKIGSNSTSDNDFAKGNDLAAAWLFRVTQNSMYHNDLQRYFIDDAKEIETEHISLDTKLVYLMTEHNVETEICEVFMEDLLNRAETLAKESETDYYLVSDAFDETFQRYLEDMKVLAIADYVIVSHEYYSLIKERLNFAYDRNKKMSRDNNVFHTTAMLFILSDILEREEAIS